MSNDTNAYRRHLPHLEKTGKTYFQTFTTRHREILTPSSREIALLCCIHDHEKTYWLHCAVVMPDHVHMIFSPFDGQSLAFIMGRVKGASAHFVNQL